MKIASSKGAKKLLVGTVWMTTPSIGEWHLPDNKHFVLYAVVRKNDMELCCTSATSL